MDQLAKTYLELLQGRLARAAEAESEPILAAALAVAERIRGGGRLHVFGSGHSQLVAMEMADRAGGLADIHAMADPGLSPAQPRRATLNERLEGYANVVLELHPVSERDAIVIVSNSGINAVTVEIATRCHRQGTLVVGIASAEHSAAAAPRHSSGKRLLEVCDIQIDTHAPVGDALIPLGEAGATGGSSTILACALLHAVLCGVVERMMAAGVKPDLLSSQNIA